MSNPLVSAGWLRNACVGYEQCVASEEESVTWQELAVSRRLFPLYGRSVMLRTRSQMATARALVELDGVAARLVLCPAELTDQQCLSVARSANVEVVVVDDAGVFAEAQSSGGQDQAQPLSYVLLDRAMDQDRVHASSRVDRELVSQAERLPLATEWILLTSGTTDTPKLVVHSFQSLTCGIEPAAPRAASLVWSTFYDIRRYGGLQVFLRAALTGARLVLSSKQQSPSEYLARASGQGVTHISGTPSHWRRALMSHHAGLIHPLYIRLSGEIADQAILDQLHHQYPQAAIVHAFASTEAGVAFEVSDGLAGVAARELSQTGPVETRIEAGTLRVRSPRTASCYLEQTSCSLKSEEGFVDTKDVLTLVGDRYLFGGRQDGTINVGGLKVHPEEIESILNSHPAISLSLVRAKPSPLVGALVVADVLLRSHVPGAPEAAEICRDVMTFCRERLPAYKVPAVVRPVASLAIAATGKLARVHA